jgi:hypothetical protein
MTEWGFKLENVRYEQCKQIREVLDVGDIYLVKNEFEAMSPSAKWQMKFRVFIDFQWFLGFWKPGNVKPGNLCHFSEIATECTQQYSNRLIN